MRERDGVVTVVEDRGETRKETGGTSPVADPAPESAGGVVLR
jgi:hypothetical protein